MIEMTTGELREELALQGLTPDQAQFVMDQAQVYAQVEFRAPATGSRIVVIGGDDWADWRFSAGRAE